MGSQHEWRRIITTNPNDAVLTVYMSDGWGGDVRSTCTAKSGAQYVLRRGKLRQEFLLQRGFIKKKQSFDGAMSTCMRVAEPLGLGLGRGAWSVFQAACDFEAIPRVLGATGITISCYVFDGCLFGPLSKHLTARHQLYYSKAHGFDHGPLHDELSAMDWACLVKCIAHSCGNSVVWGLKGVGLHDHRDNVHIAIASLLNARTALHAHVGDFLHQHLYFSQDRSGTNEEVSAFWRSLQVEHHFVDLLSDLDLHWDGRVLRIRESWSGRGDAIDEISACVLYLLSLGEGWSVWSQVHRQPLCRHRSIAPDLHGGPTHHQVSPVRLWQSRQACQIIALHCCILGLAE